MAPLAAIRRGVGASAVGTLTMDRLLYHRYHDDGGGFGFLAWESSEGVDSWDKAPAPALVAKRLLESVGRREARGAMRGSSTMPRIRDSVSPVARDTGCL